MIARLPIRWPKCHARCITVGFLFIGLIWSSIEVWSSVQVALYENAPYGKSAIPVVSIANSGEGIIAAKSATLSGCVGDDFKRILPSLVDGRVYMLDTVWVPSESKLILLALMPTMFKAFSPDYSRKHSKAYNLTFPYESLQSPVELLPNLSFDQFPVQSCQTLPAKSTSDPHVNRKLFTVHCQVKHDGNEGAHELRYRDTTLARFDSKCGTFNAADGMHFARMPRDTEMAPKNTSRLSIAIKPVSNYSPLIPDLMDYYRKQGVQHVYFGLIGPSHETIAQYQKVLDDFGGFVSLGWFKSTDVGFNYTMSGGHVLLKVMFANPVLYHAKAFQDDLLIVADLDDVLVSMNPTETSIADVLHKEIKDDTCFGEVTPHLVWRHGIKNSTRVGEHFPQRCKAVGHYNKSVAVLKNCQFVGIHGHGGCVNGTVKQSLDGSKVTLHHYTSWWGKRAWKCKGTNEMVESELATFQRHGFLA